MQDFLIDIKRKAKKKVLYLPHAMAQMNQPDRMITIEEARDVVFHGEIIEDYPEDPRGHSCLINGKTRSARYVHAVCSPKDEYLAVITAYVPSAGKWEDDFSKRRQ